MTATKDYLSLPLQTFLSDLASRTPTPGGGSVSAVTGALAAAQARMVVEYTIGKEAFAEFEAELREKLDEFRRAEEVFEQLISEDMAAYERLATTRKSDQPEEYDRAVATAAAVPMEIVVLAGAVAARIDEIKACVNRMLFSDLQVAAILAFAAASAAGVSVRVNLGSLSDRNEAARLEDQLDLIISRANKHRAAVVHYPPE